MTSLNSSLTNLSDTLASYITYKTVSPGDTITFPRARFGSWGTYIMLCFIQSVGGAGYIVKIDGNSVYSITSLITGNQYTGSEISLSYSSSGLSITANSSLVGDCAFTVIRG